jgi:hypothetical protein
VSVVAFGSRWAAYIVDFDINTTVKQLAGGRISPIFKLGTEIYFGQMPKYTCHGNITRSPWRAEIESEVIVLGILGAGDIWAQRECAIRISRFSLTVAKEPPPRCPATAFAILGFSATQRILGPMISCHTMFPRVLRDYNIKKSLELIY